MTDSPSPSTSQTTTAPERPILGRAPTAPASHGHRTALARVIPRRPGVAWWLGVILAIVFALLVVPSITADRWLDPHIVGHEPAGLTVRVPPFAGTAQGRGGGIVIERGQIATAAEVTFVAERPGGPTPYLAFLLLTAVLGAIFTHHMRRSNYGRLARVQLVSLVLIVVFAAALKAVLLTTSVSILVVPVCLFAMVPTIVLDRIVGLAGGILAALVFSFVGPFDLGVACILLVQASVAGLVVAERPKRPLRAALLGGGAATLCTAATYPLLVYVTSGTFPIHELSDIMHSPWYAATIGPAIATLLVVPIVPIYQLLVGEITQSKLVQLQDLSNPLLRQIAEKSPGTWQHSLMMANMAEIAANVIGADGRLVRVGAYYHDLGKSLQPKYFIENLEAGETSPHDQLPPEVSCDAIFAHVTEGIVAARREGLHERIVDFMHMHHGNGVLEYFWGKTREQGNPKGLTIEQFRYPGFPPQSRETAILAICDAVEAASRTLKKPDAAAIESLVQRIIYGKLHLGQLDESGLSMSDLRLVANSLRETIRHANHVRIEYPWQREAAAAAGASATQLDMPNPITATGPRLDSLDRPASMIASAMTASASAMTASASAMTASATEASAIAAKATEASNAIRRSSKALPGGGASKPPATGPEALAETADLRGLASAPVDESATTAERHALEPAPPNPRSPSVDPVGPTQRSSDEDAMARTAPVEREYIELDLMTPLPPASPAASFENEPAASFDNELEFAPPSDLDPPPRDLDPPPRDLDLPPSDLDPPIDPPPPFEVPVESGSETIVLVPSARKRAATLPPLRARRSPTIPPTSRPRAPSGSAMRRPETRSELAHLGSPFDPPASASGLDEQDPFETAVTRPPPLRRGVVNVSVEEWSDVHASAPKPERAKPAPSETLDMPLDALDALIGESGRTMPTMPAMVDDHRMASSSANTDVTRPHILLPLTAPASNPEIALPEKPWSAGLAARIDAAIDDDFGGETPVIAPTREELRALLGTPDPTRRQSLEELERLQLREAAERQRREDAEPELLRRRSHLTEEVDPDDIESAIEVAPPARRRPNAIGVAKKKPE